MGYSKESGTHLHFQFILQKSRQPTPKAIKYEAQNVVC